MICNTSSTTSSHQSIVVTSLANGFLKFLTRFSGRRRMPLRRNLKLNYCPTSASSHYFSISTLNLVIPVTLLLLLSTIEVTDACNSRTVPRPRTTPAPQAPTTTPRPNITFQTFKCPPEYATWYCLNGATCFTVKIASEVLYNCECPDGYIGPRCDYKDLDGSYLGRQRVMLETASIGGGAVAAVFLALVIGFVVYVKWHQKRKLEESEDFSSMQNGHSNGHHNAAADVVDGPSRVVLYIGQEAQVNSSSQLSRNISNATNGDSSDVQRPLQLQVVPQVHQVRRPFGPHHYHPVSMNDALAKSLSQRCT